MQIDYTIGDDIVCVKTHSQGIVKEGEVYKCLGLTIASCSCKKYLVDIGETSTNGCTLYRPCKEISTTDGIIWINATMFRKLDTLINIDEITELLEEPINY